MKMSVAGGGGGRGRGLTWSQETTAQGAADQLSDVFIAATSSRIYKYPAQPVPASGTKLKQFSPSAPSVCPSPSGDVESHNDLQIIPIFTHC